MYTGIGASHGYGLGRAVVIKEEPLTYEAKTITDTAAELKRFQAAIDAFVEKTRAIAAIVRKNTGEKEAEILEGHILMLTEDSMCGEMKKLIEQGQCAEASLESVCNMFINIFSNVEDELMKQRATDVSDIKNTMLKILLGIEDINIAALPPETIIVAEDLTPSMTASIVKENITGIVTEIGGKTSHSAILARALEIPAVLGVPNALDFIHNGDYVIIDGTEGVIFSNPESDVVAEYAARRQKYLAEKSILQGFVGKPTVTADNHRVQLFCNIGTPKDAQNVLNYDGEGIGLFRTEFLFMNNTHLPTEEEQFEAYRQAASTMNGKTVIIRTLDIGGDKDIPYMHLKKEENPFLGFRAIRYCLKHTDIYQTQLRAILRASAYGKIEIMVPLVTCLDELLAVKALIDELKKELTWKGIAYDKSIPIGVMMETPAACMLADVLAREADFFSIGTNDLTQYTMAADRGNTEVSYLSSPFQPAVLRAIRHIIKCGNDAGIPVGMCGEAAADPMMIPLLLAFGLNEFSVNPVFVLSARNIISKWTLKKASGLAEKIMSMNSETEIQAYLKEHIDL